MTKESMAFWTGRSGLSQIKRDDVIIAFLRSVELPMAVGTLYNKFLRDQPQSTSFKIFLGMIAELEERELLATDVITTSSGIKHRVLKVDEDYEVS